MKTKQQTIKELFEYIDALINQCKNANMPTYVRSKKVKFDNSRYSITRCYSVIQAKTIKGSHEVEIWFDDIHNHRPNRQKCGCAAFTFNKFRQSQPCKHIIALSEKFQQVKEKYNVK